jgi:hypothetical protein
MYITRNIFSLTHSTSCLNGDDMGFSWSRSEVRTDFFGKLERERTFEKLSADRGVILKWILKQNGRIWTGLT